MICSIIVSYIRYHRLHHHIDIDTWIHLWGRVMHLPWVWTGCIVAQYSFLSNYPNTVIKELFYCSQYIYKLDIHSHTQGIKRYIGWYLILQISILPLSYTRDKKVYWVIFDFSNIDIATWVSKPIFIVPYQTLTHQNRGTMPASQCTYWKWYNVCKMYYRTGATSQTLPGTSSFGKILWRRFLVFLFMTS